MYESLNLSTYLVYPCVYIKSSTKVVGIINPVPQWRHYSAMVHVTCPFVVGIPEVVIINGYHLILDPYSPCCMVWCILLHQVKPWVSIRIRCIFYSSFHHLSTSLHISCNITLHMIRACNKVCTYLPSSAMTRTVVWSRFIIAFVYVNCNI